MNRNKNRKALRLPEYDYAQAGAYFVTVCAWQRECVFGEVVAGEVRLNEAGEIVRSVWDELPSHYANVELDAFVAMPNHVHGIIVLSGVVGAGLRPAPTKPANERRHALPEIVRALKSFSARRINALRRTPGRAAWQRNYYEHVIRNEDELRAIWRYIEDNPLGWSSDHDNPANQARQDYWVYDLTR